MTPTLERVQFHLKPGVTDAAFLAEAEAVSAWAQVQPGFGYRTLVKDDDGLWSDLLFWTSLEAAKTAAKAITNIPQAKPFLSMIDGATVQMAHLPQLHSVMAKTPEAA